MAERTTPANPLLIITESLPGYLEDLREQRTKLLGKLRETDERIALAESLQAIAGLNGNPRGEP